MDEDLIKKIREIRSRENLTLQPSPYLRKSFLDEYGEEKPVSLRNYQAQMVANLLMMERMLCGDDTGLGKAQPVDSLVMTPSGWSRIGDLRKGDSVIGSDGLPTKVLGIFPQGVKQAYRVTMDDGSSTECCEDHLWAVRTGNSRRFGNEFHVRSLKQITAAGLMRQKNSTGLRWEIPVASPVQFPEKNLPIDPYLLGVLIGDGSMAQNLNLTNGDPVMFDIARQHFPLECQYGRTSDDGYTRNITSKVPGFNPLIRALSGLGMWGCNWYTKFIPEQYLIASVEQRAELLRGLMDTDGYVSKDGKVTQFYSSNGGLTRDFVRLVQSLGGVAYVSSKVPTLRGKSRAKKGRMAFTVTVSLPNDLVPFKLPRKTCRWAPRTKYFPSRRISSVVASRETECVCIKVAAADSLYVTDEFIVTHNTIELLSTIGYVWMKEPEYVPIIVTTKSALFQWASEVEKFMQGMEAVTISGQPFKRHALYEGFFLNHDPSKKRLLILTYDHVMYDMEESVIKEKSRSPRKGFAGELDAARSEKKAATALLAAAKDVFQKQFGDRTFDVSHYVEETLREGPGGRSVPPGWGAEDTKALAKLIFSKERLAAAEETVARLNREAAPPKKVPGLADYVGSMLASHPSARVFLVMDEIHKLKNHKSQFHTKCAILSRMSQRVVGMTATPVKNRLMEFFAIFRIIFPSLFPMVSHFQNDYCVMKIQEIPGGRKVPIVVGYKNLDSFVAKIEPYYLSRKKYDVAKELPELISVECECELLELQEELYDMAETGLLNKGDDPDSTSSDILSSMTMCQQAANSPRLIADEGGVPFEGPSSKADRLMELLEEEADGQKVIVFSRFKKMINLVDSMLEERKIKFVRITGDEADPKLREKAKVQFQNMKSGVDVILLTTAGAESINLQSAQHFVFLDLPWSWGDYVQLVGRMQRIGSSHNTIVAHHFLSRKRDGKKTIDHYVLKALRSKKRLADKVAGESLKGGLVLMDGDGDSIRDVMEQMRTERDPSVAPVAKIAGRVPARPEKKEKKPALKKAAPAPEEDVKITPLGIDFSDI